MTKFLVVYNSKMSAAEVMSNATPEEAQAGMDAWMAWAKDRGDSIVDLGVPLGSSKHIAADSVADGSTEAAGYSIIEAASLDEAVKVLEGHPHFTMPGNTIDVLEFLPMPGT